MTATATGRPTMSGTAHEVLDHIDRMERSLDRRRFHAAMAEVRRHQQAVARTGGRRAADRRLMGRMREIGTTLP